MSRILIGIPCYRDVAGETLEDYMRLAFYCGRRLPQHEFLIGIKTKTEQFRARNAIVTGAIQANCDYLFFLDDDHVIDWDSSSGPNIRYGLIDRLVEHMENDPDLGIVGAVYYQRGGECRPVLMREGRDGGFYWLRDDELTGGLQEVSVQGGGCMLMRMSMFDKIPEPYFEPEFDLGTDLQICKKAKEAGYKVACDTSLIIGHVMSKREIVTPQNRARIAADGARVAGHADEGINQSWKSNSAMALYRTDAEEYLGMGFHQIATLATEYSMARFDEYQEKGDLEGYYRNLGKPQIARQVMFHHLEECVMQLNFIHSLLNFDVDAKGLDFGCGTAPVGFECVLRGHSLDFVDVDGAAGYEFTKWRARKRGVEDRCGWSVGGPYDYALLLDSIEHIEDWRGLLDTVAESLKDNGALITNFFHNTDFLNKEHISMDHEAVKAYLVSLGIYPVNEYWVWAKRSIKTSAA